MEENKFENENQEENEINTAETVEKNETQAENEEATYAFRWDYDARSAEAAAKAKKSQKKGVLIYAGIVTAALLLCLSTLVVLLFIDGYANVTETKVIEKVVYVRENDPESGILTVPEIAEKVKPSVVSILTEKTNSSGIGTGIIIREDGYIATNAHVVDKTISLTVVLSDGTEYEAEIVASDSVSDLAVIKIEAEGLSEAELGDSDAIVVGELAVAIGTPAGIDLAGTTTAGIISGVHRNIKVYNEITGDLEKTMLFIQTTADITGGNSGGPLVNEKGQVIGINTMKLDEGYDGVGFSIPINEAMLVIDRMIEEGGDFSSGGEVAKKRAVIGISGGDVDQSMGAPVAGFYVSEVTEGYDAANHLKMGDIIVGIDSNEVLSKNDISKVLNELNAGDKVKLTVYRDGKIFDVTVTLGEEK